MSTTESILAARGVTKTYRTGTHEVPALAQVLAGRVAIMDHGRIVALDTPEGHIATLGEGHHLHVRLPEGAQPQDMAGLAGVAEVVVGPGVTPTYELTVSDPRQAVPALFTWAAEADIELLDVRIAAPTLEDVFLARTGSRLRD
jgi:ABC-2 type transport system ATP-binding protein